MFSLFVIRITLTESGVANWILAVRVIFEYIGMLAFHGPQKWIFDELSQIAQLEYGEMYII
jgi:secreted Zn-dependent insulinase-like peptidase